MSAQRVGLMAMRRAAATAQQPVFFAQHIPRLALTASSQQSRPISTEKLTPQDANALLAAQRLRRPVSPHLSVYDYKQTWFGGSIMQRFTGATLAGSLYAFSAVYLAAPLLGWHLESASLAAAFATWPVLAKGSVKFLFAWPFTFHAFNGVRHLIWDFAVGFEKSNLKTVSRYVAGASILTALGLAAFL